MITLQRLLLPKAGICFEQQMYFRYISIPDVKKPLNVNAEAQYIEIKRKGTLTFDTYFNSFSIGKWRKYTNAGEIKLFLDLKGSFEISLYHSKILDKSVVKKVLQVKQSTSSDRNMTMISFPECDENGLLSFGLRALSDDCVFYGGYYATEIPQQGLRPVRIAVNICNYMREAYIYRTISILNRYILQNEDSPLKEHLEVYIADNSSSIDYEKIRDERIHVFPQGDFGGSGGFTRGLIEVIADKEKCNLTHIIMMDDDILLEPDSLERTYAFLQLIKDPYVTAFLGGSLLRLDQQNVQYINGGEWSMHDSYIMHKMGYDLNREDHIIKNEIEDGARINGWWYHCIPLTQVSNENLPFPFFFHMDDVEYDLRNCKKVINLNGICVWHEPFENKPGSQLHYYNSRNVTIAHMIYYNEWSKKQVKKFILTYFSSLIPSYRYKEARLVLRGIEDAMRGSQWLVSQNCEELLEDVLAHGYKKTPLEQLPIRLDYQKYLHSFEVIRSKESKKRRIFRRLTLNGYLLPAKGDTVTSMFEPMIRVTYRAKRVLCYDPISARAFITEKSYRECFKLVFEYFRICRVINKKFDTARADYKESFPKITNLNFWRKYLNIEKA